MPILGAIPGVLGLLILWLKAIASTGFWKPIYCLDVDSKTAVTPKAVFASERHYNMCIETRAGHLLCDTQIKYSPLRIRSGEDDKPSLNPSGEKHREKPYPLAYVYSCLSNLSPHPHAMTPNLKLSMSSPWLLNATAAISFFPLINTLIRLF